MLCLEGELETELADGRRFTLQPGMSYHVADGAEPHRSSTRIGRKTLCRRLSMRTATKSPPTPRDSTYARSTPTSRVRTGRRAFRSKSSSAPLRNSLCFGVYEKASGAQVGFTRVVTDYATFAYLCDVYVLEEHRGHGLGKRMMREVMAHPALAGARRVMLATRDAHGLYRQSGFVVAGVGAATSWRSCARTSTAAGIDQTA